MLPESKQFYDFANFRLDISEKILLRDGAPVPLTPKVFDTLKILIENAGRLLEKTELMEKIWRDRFVEEGNLAFNIKVLRKALGDNAAHPRFIETVPRRGYRFIAEVNEAFAESKDSAPENETSPTEKDFGARQSKNLRLPLAVGAGLLLVVVALGGWIVRNGFLGTNAPLLSAPFASEKLSTNGKVVHAAVSPDGKNVIYTNGTGSDKESVWLRQIESGSNVEIIPPSDDVYAGLALSPDGNFLYFVRRPRNAGVQAALYRVSIFGGVPHKILDEPQGWISVSPDGARVSFVRCDYRDDENCSLWIADAADGANERKLAARPRPFRISDNGFSPDGKRIAFAVGQSENAANEFGLMEIDLETGAERELTKEKFFNIKNLAWLPDGGGLLMTASRIPNKNFRIWQISAASGEAVPLTKDSETYSALSLDKTARVLVSTQVEQNFRLQLFEIENPSAGRFLTDASAACFAPDGKIIFSSPLSGNDEIWSINPDGINRRQLTNTTADESSPVVSADNNSIFFASNRTGAAHVWRMKADGSNQMQVTRKEGGFPIFASPDGEWIYYHHGVNRTLRRVSLKTGDEQIVFDKTKYRFAVSPDGARIAFSERQGEERILTVASLAGGQTLKTFRLADRDARLLEIVWLPDGKNLAYVSANRAFENNILWMQPVDEETPRRIADLGDEEVVSLSPAPDGKTLAVVNGRWLHDAVLLKGLQ